MSLEEPLPPLPPRQPGDPLPETVRRLVQLRQAAQPRQQEADLLQRLHQWRAEPALAAVRQLLVVRLARCQDRLVKASLEEVQLLQG